MLKLYLRTLKKSLRYAAILPGFVSRLIVHKEYLKDKII